MPGSAKEIAAEIEFLNLLRATAEAVRIGERVDLCKLAVAEIERCDARLIALKRNAKRCGERKKKEQVAA